jgi:Family of unknown function (DUF6152)
MKRIVYALILAGALAVPAIAHHSFGPFYDASKTVDAQGVVTKLLVKNPHSVLYFDETKNGEKIEWQIELGTGAQLQRNNLTIENLKPGTEIKVQGRPARNPEAHGMCCVLSLTKADGTPILRGRVPEK